MFQAKEETPLRGSGDAKLLVAPTNASYQTESTIPDDEPKRKIKRVHYSAKNHVQIIFQMHGSALPQVLPFCIMNVLWTLLIYYLQKSGVCDMEFKSGTGHTFMGLLVSFLVVSRSGIAYNRFMTNREQLSESYRACRELVQFACVYTFRTQTSNATKWRQEVAYRTILLLRVTMDTLRWSSEHIDHWHDSYDPQCENTHRMSSLLSHSARTKADENFRAPTMYSHILRETIMKHPDFLNYTMPVNEYRDMLNFVTIFHKAFHGFRVVIFNPYPFPLMQMNRIFLFFWVYSLPLVLMKSLESVVDTCVIIFLITFGFVGTEYVSMMLDDHFSTDTGNIDQQGLAELVFEDIYLSLWRTDGQEAAMEVKERVMECYNKGQECFQHDMNMDSSFWNVNRAAAV